MLPPPPQGTPHAPSWPGLPLLQLLLQLLVLLFLQVQLHMRRCRCCDVGASDIDAQLLRLLRLTMPMLLPWQCNLLSSAALFHDEGLQSRIPDAEQPRRGPLLHVLRQALQGRQGNVQGRAYLPRLAKALALMPHICKALRVISAEEVDKSVAFADACLEIHGRVREVIRALKAVQVHLLKQINLRHVRGDVPDHNRCVALQHRRPWRRAPAPTPTSATICMAAVTLGEGGASAQSRRKGLWR